MDHSPDPRITDELLEELQPLVDKIHKPFPQDSYCPQCGALISNSFRWIGCPCQPFPIAANAPYSLEDLETMMGPSWGNQEFDPTWEWAWTIDPDSPEAMVTGGGGHSDPLTGAWIPDAAAIAPPPPPKDSPHAQPPPHPVDQPDAPHRSVDP